jgi:DNA repair exonuclease SbcCD ATPase subunit
MTEVSTRTIHTIATEINGIKDQTQKMFLLNSIEIGRRLTEAKAMLPHGEWAGWLKESVSFSQSTANNLMRVFEEYGSDQLSLFGDNAKSQAFGNLTYSQAVALLGVPEEEREQFVQENDVENMSSRELQRTIKEKKQLEQQLKDAEAKAQEAAAAAEKERQERERLAKKMATLETKANDHTTIVKRLKQQLKDAQAAGDVEVANKAQEQLRQSQLEVIAHTARIKELEAELKKKPAKEIVEKVPDAVEHELASLRATIAKQAQSKAAAKFTVCFETLVKGFSDMLASLGEFKEPEEHEKYKGAVRGLIDKMSERL